MLTASGICAAALPATLDLGQADASFYGEAELDQSGFQVVGVGDVNGDQFDDILITAPGSHDSAGKIYLVFGRSSGLGPLTNLSQADASFIGENAGDQAGTAVASAGDFNKDGLMDIAIGAPFYTTSAGYAAGKVYVIYGKGSGWSKDLSLANADVSFVGEASMSLAGFSIAPAGDVNKDGYQDLAIGAYGMSSWAGKVYVVLGATASSFGKDMSLANYASFTGEAADDYAGYSIAGIGDANRDGYSDLLIGAYHNSQRAAQAGKVYLISGHAGSWSKNSPLSQVGSYYLGQSAKDYAGFSVSGAGDMNRDGFADFLIGAPGRDNNGDASGMAALVYGKSGAGGAYDLGQVDARFNGEYAGDSAGARVAGLGDVDGDGYADIMISGYLSDRVAEDAGALYLIRGTYAKQSGTRSLSGSTTIVTGENALDNAGWSVAGAGDVDDDGFADMIVSAYGSDANGAASGMSYLFETGLMVDLDGDAFSEAMGDCNDSNPAQHPGAREIPNNTIDEDCRGGDLTLTRVQRR